MARTGPQKIPGASLAYFYGDGRYSGSAMEVNCGVVHTTEGRTLPGYDGGALAPTVTGVPDIAARKIRWYQHYDVDESARALANKLGGVETNTANAFQVELVGTCDDAKKTTWGSTRAGVDYLYWPDAPEWALLEVALLVRWLNTDHGVPLTCVRDWLAYGPDSRRPGVVPASYGASPARMTQGEWRAFTGWCGHQHVPENDHGDPGSMPFAQVIALAKGAATEEDDMPTTAEIADAVFKKFAAGGGVLENSDVDRVAAAVVAKLQPVETAQSATIDKLVGAIATLAANIGDLDPAAIVAELKASIESITIHLDVPEA